MKTVRRIIFILIIIASIVSGVYITGVITDLLSFQVTLYSYVLEGQEAVGKVTGAANDLRREAQELIGKETASRTPGGSIESSERLQAYASKIQRFASILGIIGAIITYLFLTKIIFGFREQLKRIQSFIQ